MRPLLLALGLLAVPFVFARPATAGFLPPCCVSESKIGHPPDPHNGSPIFVPAEVRRPDERALEAAAEAPVEVQVPLASAIAPPLPAVAEAIDPEREPERLGTEQSWPSGLNDHLSPCCQLEGESHPPDPDRESAAPILIGAYVRHGYDRALEGAVELPIPAKAPLVDATGIPLAAQRGVSEPVYRPDLLEALASALPGTRPGAAQMALAVLLLLTMGYVLLRPKLQPQRLEYRPAGRFPGNPEDWLQPGVASIPVVEPRRHAEKEREIELA
jgi:hypothetical protein